MDDEHIEYADPQDLPDRISDDPRRMLKSIIRGGKGAEGSWSTENRKVPKSLCEFINTLHDEGVGSTQIIDMIDHINSVNTICYHLRGDCSHDSRMRILRDECGWMRIKAQQGAGSAELAEEYDIAKENVAVHVTGRCSHDCSIEPISGDQLYKNSRSNEETITTSVCPVCDDQFEHREYRERTTCSQKCNSKWANMKAKENSKKESGA